jgi:hypothetical protein
MLLDPLKKQLDPSTQRVERRDREYWYLSL